MEKLNVFYMEDTLTINIAEEVVACLFLAPKILLSVLLCRLCLVINANYACKHLTVNVTCYTCY
jgi:hypothetical protein